MGEQVNTKSNDDRKLEILNAATRVLTKKGLQAFSFATVADEAGLSRQLVRYHFSDLDELIGEVCDYLGKAYQDLLVAGILEVGEVGRLKFFLDFFFGLSQAHPLPDNLEAYDALFAYAVGSAPLKKRLWAKYETLGQVMKHELAIAHPELEGFACEELSFLFVSMMHAHWSYVATLGYSAEHNQLARSAFDRLIASYISEPSLHPAIERPWSRSD